jgi:hypothetical protein
VMEIFGSGRAMGSLTTVDLCALFRWWCFVGVEDDEFLCAECVAIIEINQVEYGSGSTTQEF